MIQDNVISSARLDLILMSPEFLQASSERRQTSAEGILGVTIPPDWFDFPSLMQLRLGQMQQTPAYRPWSLRAVVLREQKRMIGHIGFHSVPDPEYLRQLAPGGLEFGYTIFPAFRRKGYALEAATALMNWASRDERVVRFVLSISPENVASLRLAQRLGFVQIGSQMDEEDGLENIYELQRESFRIGRRNINKE